MPGQLARELRALLAQLDPFAGNNRYGDVWGEGDFAYLGSFNGSGVAIIDISEPTQPRELAHVELQPVVRAVSVEGQYAYLAAGWSGLVIVDISDPCFIVGTRYFVSFF